MAFFDIKPAVGITVEAAEGYDQSYSGMQALIEGYQNDYALFTGALYQDIKEYSMVHEGASVDEIVALQEASISGFFNKIKEFFKKLWAKIKALFHRFIAKFDSMFMKSGKDLLKKYKKEIELKDTSELEIKFQVAKNSDSMGDIYAKPIEVSVANVSDPKKELEDFDADEFSCKVVKDFTGMDISNMSDFDKDFHDHLFEDEDDVKWDTIRSEVYEVLENEKNIKNIEKASHKMDVAIAGIIKALNKDESAFAKGSKSDTEHPGINVTYRSSAADSSGSTATVSTDRLDKTPQTKDAYLIKQAALNLLSKRASATQVAINKISAGLIREVKFHASQCRAAVAKAVAYKPKNEAAGLDTIADAVAYDPTILL